MKVGFNITLIAIALLLLTAFSGCIEAANMMVGEYDPKAQVTVFKNDKEVKLDLDSATIEEDNKLDKFAFTVYAPEEDMTYLIGFVKMPMQDYLNFKQGTFSVNLESMPSSEEHKMSIMLIMIPGKAVGGSYIPYLTEYNTVTESTICGVDEKDKETFSVLKIEPHWSEDETFINYEYLQTKEGDVFDEFELQAMFKCPIGAEAGTKVRIDGIFRRF